MDNPQQTLLHLTSRGGKVRTQQTGAVGRFINQVGQPINNINKFGLLHYSIPKTLDFLDEGNRTFGIRVTYRQTLAGGKNVTLDIPVTLPLMDYYNMKVDTMSTQGVCLTEVLQTSINWAIQKEWTKNSEHNTGNVGPSPIRGPTVSNRIGCIVRMTDDKKLQFLFGYRGERNVVMNTGRLQAIRWTGAIHANSGSPVPVQAEGANPDEDEPAILAQNNCDYRWIDTAGVAWNMAPFPGEGANVQHGILAEFQLHKVMFYNLSPRLQLLFGADSKALESPTQWLRDKWVNYATGATGNDYSHYEERGRIILVNYLCAVDQQVPGIPTRTGLIDFTMPIQPNMYPPSFMFLQLTAQGTKTKVLGHNAERGGWSVPCAANQFKSKYDNFPGFDKGYTTFVYNEKQARNIPAMMNRQQGAYAVSGAYYYEYQTKQENNPLWPGAGQPNPNNYPEFLFPDDGNLPQSERFDQIPYDPASVVVGEIYPELRNYSLVINTDFAGEAAGDNNHKFGSRMIHYGDIATQTCLAHKNPREDKQFGMQQVVEAPTFTVSMIDPNWIYTDVPNSTLQSLNCLLMWGDTSENVEDTCANPVQFSMIASQ